MRTDQLSDREAFQRVWRRVMPHDSPLVPEPAAPLPAPPADWAGVCLGETSVGALPTLDRMLLLTLEGWRAYRVMAGRSRRASLPAALAQAKHQQFRRLAAARFLISGEVYELPDTEAPAAADLPLWVRERYQAEQRTAAELLAAVGDTGDPCLIELYRSLAIEDQTHAGQLREWLERM